MPPKRRSLDDVLRTAEGVLRASRVEHVFVGGVTVLAFDARRILHEEFVQWFSIDLAGSEENFGKMAREVWAAWGRHRNGPATELPHDHGP